MSNVMNSRLKKLIEEDRKKNVFKTISEICKSEPQYDAEWLKEQLLKIAPTPKN